MDITKDTVIRATDLAALDKRITTNTTDLAALKSYVSYMFQAQNFTGYYSSEGYYIVRDALASYINSYNSFTEAAASYHNYEVNSSTKTLTCTDSSNTSLQNRFTCLKIHPLGSSLKWANSSSSTMYTTTYSTSTDKGKGAANTTLLMNAAASSGEKTTSGNIWYELQQQFWSKGLTNWYIPSRDDLSYIYSLFSSNSSWSKPYSSYVWSSSQDSDVSNGAWNVSFSNGYTDGNGKSGTRAAFACAGLDTYSF